VTANPLPAWAVVGAKVLIEPGSYSRNRVFREATVTRITKTSVFAKSADPMANERRFVPSTWRDHGDRMVEYGNRSDSWRHDTYLWDPESPAVAEAKATAARQAVEETLANACAECERAMHKGGKETKAEKVAALQAALAAYTEATK